MTARKAAAAWARRQDPAVKAREAEAKSACRQADPELKACEAEAKRAQRQADPELKARVLCLYMPAEDLCGGCTGFPITSEQAPLTSFTSWIW